MLTWDEYCALVWRIRHGLAAVGPRALLLVLAMLPAVAMGQTGPPLSYAAPWAQVGATAPISVTTSSSAPLALPVYGTPAPTSVRVCNQGTTNDAYVVLGGASVVATTGGTDIPPSTCSLVALPKDAAYIAAITSTSTTTISVAIGTGSSADKGGGGGGGGTSALISGHIFVGNGSNVATDVAPSADVSAIATSGAFTVSGIGGVAPGQGYAAACGTGLTCPTAGTAGAINLTSVLHDISGSGVAIVTGDAAKTDLLGAFTYPLAQAGTAGFTSGWGTTLLCVSGPCTVTTTTSTFAPAVAGSSLVLQTGDAAFPTSDNANYQTTVAHGAIPIAVASGGTGLATITTHSLLVGNGTSAPNLLAAAADSVPLWQSNSADPTVTAINNCTAASSALTYATASHTFGCNTISGSSTTLWPTYQANSWYLPMIWGASSTVAGNILVAATAYCSPILIPTPIHIQALAVTTGTAAAGNIQMAIYNNSTTNRPGTNVTSTSSVSTNSANPTVSSLNVNISTAGLYWTCVQEDATAVANSVTVRSLAANSNLVGPMMMGSATIGNVNTPTANLDYVSTTTGVSSYGTWPDFTSATWTEGAGNQRGTAVYFEVLTNP